MIMQTSVKSVLKVYFREVKRYKLLVFLVFTGLGLTIAADLAVPIFYKTFFDTITVSLPSALAMKTLVVVLVKILFLNILIWVGYRLAVFSASYFQPRVMADLKERAFDYLMNHSYSFFANSFAGALVQRLNRLARSFERFSDRIFWDLFPLITRIIAIVIILWHYNQTITLITIAWILLLSLINCFLSVWKLKYDIKRAAKDSEVTAVMADAITNSTTIQLFTGFSFESSRFKKVVEEWRKITTFTWDLASAIDAIQAALYFLIEFFLFYFGLKYWSLGLLTVGTFVMVQSYLLQIMHRFWDFGRVVRDIYESFADATEMVEILETPYEVKDVPKAKSITINKGEIEFKEVRFSFHLTREVLRGINLIIRPGERVALIGPSGAGKSTLVKLLLRLYDVGGGQILIDGQNIAKVTQESLRANLSLVPQDPILFHRTLMENIRYGQREATDEEVYRAAELAHCDDFIKDLPQGYETYVGERGIKLSGGERQRVAIARAILKDAPILILDEATSSLDSRSESLIQEALDNLMKGRTVIAIAHRLSTIRKVNRIVVMDNGRIIEEGSHDELLKNPQSLYYKLWTLQAGGFLKE